MFKKLFLILAVLSGLLAITVILGSIPKPKTVTATPFVIMGEYGEIYVLKSHFEIEAGKKLDLSPDIKPTLYKGPWTMVGADLCRYSDGSKMYVDGDLVVKNTDKIGVCRGAVSFTFYKSIDETEVLKIPVTIVVK